MAKRAFKHWNFAQGLGCAALCVLVAAGEARAQSAPANGLQPSPLQTYAENLYNDGITFNSRYLGEFAANPSGGARQGAEYAGELNLGADFDLAKLGAPDLGTVHVLFTDRAGNNLASKSINNSVSVQQIYGDGQTYQLTMLAYEQKLFNNRLDVELGRIDIAEDTAVSPFYCYFQSNASCGNPSLMGKDVYIGSSYYPIAVWGGRAKLDLTDNIYFKTGIYQSAPQENPNAQHGFDWSLDKSDGVQIPLELGYADTPSGAIAPNQYDIGAAIDRTHYQAGFADPSAPTQYGRSVVYLQFQQLVYQTAPSSPRGLYLFGVGEVGTAGQTQPSDYSFQLGGVFQGPFASRPLDDVGLMVNDLHYRKDYLNSLYAVRVAEGGTQRPSADLVMLELNYTAQLNPWLNFTPNVQYVINPDGLGGLAYPKSNEKNAFVIGLQFNLDVARALGLVMSNPS